MTKSILSAARQLEQLLKHKLIPFAQNGAPLILFDTPPRSWEPLNIQEKRTPPLPIPLRKKSYPGIVYWPQEQINSIEVPVLGCIFEGEADYDIRNPPGKPGCSWLVPVRAGTLFVVKPGIPFTADKLAWERALPKQAYARGAVMHLRHDGIMFQSYTIDNGQLWKHPSLFLHEPQTYLLGERLLQELRKAKSTFAVISHHYILLIFYLMQRSLAENRYAKGYAALRTLSYSEEGVGELQSEFEAPFPDPVSLANEYISEHLDDVELSSQKVAAYTGLSSRHLNRLFKEQESVSLFDYLQNQKLAKACLLLENPAISIQQIAAYCGFRQRSHFSAWFTKRNSTSPTAFRQKMNRRK